MEFLGYLHLHILQEQQESQQEVVLSSSLFSRGFIALLASFLSLLNYVPVTAFLSSEPLQMGNESEQVRLLQSQLNNWGFPIEPLPPLEATGRFDARTQEAVSQFQKYFGLPQNGIVDSETSSLLQTPRVTASLSLLQTGNQNNNLELMSNAVDSLYDRASKSGLFDDGFEVVSSYQKEVLASLAVQSKETVPGLAKVLSSQSDSFLRLKAAKLLGLMGADAVVTTPTLKAVFQDQNQEWQLRAAAAEILGQNGFDSTVVADLTAIVRDSKQKPEQRIGAATALGNIGSNAETATPDLAAIVRNRQNDKVKIQAADPIKANLRAAAANALGKIGGDAETVADLTTIVKDTNESNELRSETAVALGQIGVNSDSFVADLITIARNKNTDITLRSNALVALGRLGTSNTADGTVTDLATILKDQSEEVYLRVKAAQALGNLGATAAIPDLIAVLRDTAAQINLDELVIQSPVRNDEPPVRGDEPSLPEAISIALAMMDVAAVPSLVQALTDSNRTVRYSAAFTLGLINLPATQVVQSLTSVMNNSSEDQHVRWMAASSLERMGQDTQGFFSTSNRASLLTLLENGCPIATGYGFIEYRGGCAYFAEGGTERQINRTFSNLGSRNAARRSQGGNQGGGNQGGRRRP